MGNICRVTLVGVNSPWRIFSYKELYTATNGFSEENKLGEGGFGSVYWGKTTDGLQVLYIYRYIYIRSFVHLFWIPLSLDASNYASSGKFIWFWLLKYADSCQKVKSHELKGWDGICSRSWSSRTGSAQKFVGSSGLLCGDWSAPHSLWLHAQSKLAFLSPWSIFESSPARLEKENENHYRLCWRPTVSLNSSLLCTYTNVTNIQLILNDLNIENKKD